MNTTGTVTESLRHGWERLVTQGWPASTIWKTPSSDTAAELRDFVTRALASLPWRVVMTDWRGESYECGGDTPHFSGEPLRVVIKTEEAGRDILGLDGMRFLERFLEGDVDMSGNLYALASIRKYADLELKPWHLLRGLARGIAFQDTRRAKVSVKSHYDIPQEALNVYLDRVYMSYSCGMFEEPDRLDISELTRIGEGQRDDWDSLEKAMWRKFKDAVDYVAPAPGEQLLDVGCGYGGQLVVALDHHPFGKVVGWTHSANQVREGRAMLSRFDPERWELHEGDYRQDERVFDHITSTGMISHVGPRGLVPYVRNIRRRIKTGGRYLHHALMTCYRPEPIDTNLGIAFNKRYVWPGFHWFTLGDHMKALEKNGFQVARAVSLTRHYAKTTTAWYERMMQNREVMVQNLGEPTFRAWQVFLAGITGSYLNKHTHVYRLYCEAV
jgi:cyclopropane-fatty-acyl-phospholipid synthase